MPFPAMNKDRIVCLIQHGKIVQGITERYGNNFTMIEFIPFCDNSDSRSVIMYTQAIELFPQSPHIFESNDGNIKLVSWLNKFASLNGMPILCSNRSPDKSLNSEEG